MGVGLRRAGKDASCEARVFAFLEKKLGVSIEKFPNGDKVDTGVRRDNDLVAWLEV